jgi:hypothetical protein
MSAVKWILKLLAYGIAALVLYALAQQYPWVTALVGGALVWVAAHEIIKDAVREVVREELRLLQEQGYSNRHDIQTIDRKVGAIWDRIREISGG